MYAILAWPPLLRPPLPNEEPPVVPEMQIPLKALACRNQVTSLAALVTSDEPVRAARLVLDDFACEGGVIPGSAAAVRVVGAVPTPEAGMVCDPLYEVDEFSIDRSASLLISVRIPKTISPGTYRGTVSLVVGDSKVAQNSMEIEVADVLLPNVHDWDFFLNVWMNPGAVAGRHGVEMWSDQHFALLRPYVEDLAAHGQKTVVAPICYQPWGTQTRDPYPNAVVWRKRGDTFEFDFSIFDRYVAMHAQCGIDRAIHCYSIVQGPGASDESVIAYRDDKTEKRLLTKVSAKNYARAWSAFFLAFRSHLQEKGWLDKTYIAFDEKPDEVMEKLVEFLDEHASDFKVALAGNAEKELASRLDDLCVHAPFNSRGIAETVPPGRAAMGMAELLAPHSEHTVAKGRAKKTITTFYVCCGPEFPNTFLFSPLVESRMLPYLAAQGGYDGFLRWSYNDWPDDPYQHPQWGSWPTGDVFFVYPGEKGPVSSLRWEQLREGIQDYQLAMIASANIQSPDEMVDYEQAISLACRNVDGRAKSIGDIEIARRLLIPIAAHQQQ